MIECVKYRQDKELLLSVHIKDSAGHTCKTFTFYNTGADKEREPNLGESVEMLPELLKSMYDEGRKGTEIEFAEKEIRI